MIAQIAGRLLAKDLDRVEVMTSGGVGYELAMVPKNTVHVEGKDAEAVLKLIESLEELDDVQKVWANLDINVSDMAEQA